MLELPPYLLILLGPGTCLVIAAREFFKFLKRKQEVNRLVETEATIVAWEQGGRWNYIPKPVFKIKSYEGEVRLEFDTSTSKAKTNDRIKILIDPQNPQIAFESKFSYFYKPAINSAVILAFGAILLFMILFYGKSGA